MSQTEGSKPVSPVKAAMSVVLKADDVVVAQVEDPVLWNEVFAAISSRSSRIAAVIPVSPTGQQPAHLLPAADPIAAAAVANTPAIEPINKFAKELNVDVNVLAGALDPTPADPFVRLDLHHWEKMRTDLPSRGPKALAPIVIAATALCLWARHAGFGTVTQAQCQNALDQIGARDNNPTRGVASADWLQQRGGGLVALNPAKVSKAVCIVSAFCTQDWNGWKSL